MREDADLSQKDLSELLSIRQNTYSQYETGLRQIPLESLMQLALFYHTSVDYILNLTDVRLPYPRKKIEETEDDDIQTDEHTPEE